MSPGRAPAEAAHSIPPATPRGRGESRKRLLLEGNIVPTLLRLAAPNLVVNVSLIVVTATVDAYFVSRLGNDALAGISLVFPLLMLMQQVANASMGGAIASAISRSIGAGRGAEASALVVHSIIIAVGMAVIFSATLLLGGPTIYRWMGGEAERLTAALDYSNPIFAGALAYWLLSTFTSIIRGTGQVALLAFVYIAAEALHILLVPIAAFGLGPIPPLGIMGVGLATILSFTASSLFLGWYIASGRTVIEPEWRKVRLSRQSFHEILRVGIPMSFPPFLNNLALAVLTGFVASLGAVQLAGFGIAVRLEYLLYPLAYGLGAGMIAMIGMNIGAGNTARTVRIAWLGAAIAAGVTACIGLVAAAFPSLWTGLFAASGQIHAAAAGYLIISGLAYPFLGLGVALGSASQAAGKTFWPLLGTTCRVFVVIAGGWIALNVIGAGLTGLAFVAAAGLVTYGITLLIPFCRKGPHNLLSRQSMGSANA